MRRVGIRGRHQAQKGQQSLRRTVIPVAVLPVLPIFGLFCMRWDQPKWLSRMTGPDELLVGGVLMLLLAVNGLLWMSSTLRVVGEDRGWSWWIAIAPAVVIAERSCFSLSRASDPLRHYSNENALSNRFCGPARCGCAR